MTTPTEPMSDERIAEIHEREQAATTGPWSGYGSKPFEVFQEPGPSDEDSVYVTHGSDREADAEFIVAARQDIPDLLAEVERLRAERARAMDALGDIGRTAEAVGGDQEDGINAELTAAHAERDRLAEQVKRVRQELDRAHLTTDGMLIQRDSIAAAGNLQRALGIEAGANEIRRIVRRVRAALDGTEAGR